MGKNCSNVNSSTPTLSLIHGFFSVLNSDLSRACGSNLWNASVAFARLAGQGTAGKGAAHTCTCVQLDTMNTSILGYPQGGQGVIMR